MKKVLAVEFCAPVFRTPEAKLDAADPIAKKSDPEILDIPMEDWSELERNFCRRDNVYRPAQGVPSLTQLDSAAKEFHRRFMSAEGKDSGVPGVLVATAVDAELWFEKSEHEARHKCLLTDSGDLFLIHVPSQVHEKTVEETNDMIKAWLRGLGGPLPELITTSTNLTDRFLRGTPDFHVHPSLPWNAADGDLPKSRVVIEVEYKHRGPSKARQWGRRLLTRSHFIRAYVLIKVYPRDAANNFAAVALVWRQGPVPTVAGPLGAAPAANPLFPAIAAPLTPPELAQQALAAAPRANAAAAAPGIGAPLSIKLLNLGLRLSNPTQELLSRRPWWGVCRLLPLCHPSRQPQSSTCKSPPQMCSTCAATAPAMWCGSRWEMISSWIWLSFDPAWLDFPHFEECFLFPTLPHTHNVIFWFTFSLTSPFNDVKNFLCAGTVVLVCVVVVVFFLKEHGTRK